MTVNDNGNSTTATDRVLGSISSSDPMSELGKVKQVHLHKHDSDELGMAILGGIEHGLPIMISEVFPGSSVARSQKVRFDMSKNNLENKFKTDIIFMRTYNYQNFLFLF